MGVLETSMFFGKLLIFFSAVSAGFYYNKANGISRTKRGSLVSSMLAKEHDRHAMRKDTIEHLLGLFNMVESKRSPEMLPDFGYPYYNGKQTEIKEETEN